MRAGVVALALTGGLVAGCSGQVPGTAAVVDGERITEREVEAVATELSPFLAEPLTPTSALASIIQADEIVEVASENGLGASEDDARTTLAAISEQQGVQPPAAYDEATILVARSLVVLQSLAQAPDAAAVQEQVTERLAAVDVTISPRYGTWDPSGAIVAPAYEWLEVPAPVVQ